MNGWGHLNRCDMLLGPIKSRQQMVRKQTEADGTVWIELGLRILRQIRISFIPCSLCRAGWVKRGLQPAAPLTMVCKEWMRTS